MKNRLISIVLVLALITSLFAGCSNSSDGYDFIYPFDADVNSYDPQVASTSDEFLIIENTFEGLIRINDDGEVISAMADKWEISDDGLTYTFHIRTGMKWDIKTDKYTSGDNKGEYKDERLNWLGYEFNPDITADDFVFALQRAADPVTDCPLFSTISAIKNANAIHSGNMDKENLGVVATNPNVLTITLEHKDDSFMETLTSAVAMPCNEEFFNATKGRYGLSTKYTLFNGQFYVNEILETSYLLKANDKYTGPNPTKATELTLKILDDDERKKIIANLEKGYYDAAFISGHDSDEINKNSGITYTDYQDTTWAFIFNSNDEVFQSKNMRAAFCYGLSHPESFDKEYLSSATNLTPSSCQINANNACSAMGETVVEQDQSESIKDWESALTTLGVTDITITILTPDYMQDAVKQVIQGVQSGLGTSLKNSEGTTVNLTLKIEAKTVNEIKNLMATSEYDVAFLPFNSTSNSATAFLSSVNDSGYGEYDTDAVENYIASAQEESDLTSISANLRKAENEIISSYTICPSIYETSYYAAAKGVENIQFHVGSGRVSFVSATRK